MNVGLERACLAIADVSGYTGYMAGVELDHAQDILADLISTIVTAMAPFQLSKLEGDAAFSFLPGEEIDGSMLQDTIEGTYVAFRARLRNIQQASSCECNACIRIPTLDLKFVVHQGAFARQRMVGLEELVGSDVILIHRLLKNEIKERTGVAAYAFYTQSTLDAAGIEPLSQGLVEHHEITDIAGEVTGWVRDLEAHWQIELGRPRREIAPDTLLREYIWEVPTPPSVTFDYLTSPRLRPLWDTTITKFDEELDDGRRGVGTTNHCMHGENAIREDVLDWRPPYYWLMKGIAAFMPNEPAMYLSDELVALPDGGTRIISRAGLIEGDTTDPELGAMMLESFAHDQLIATGALKGLLQAKVDEALDAPVPAPPESASRYLTEPIAIEGS